MMTQLEDDSLVGRDGPQSPVHRLDPEGMVLALLPLLQVFQACLYGQAVNVNSEGFRLDGI